MADAPTPATKPQPVLIIMSILAGLQVLTGGAALSDVIGLKPAGLLILAVAATQVGMGYYLRGQVVPFGDVGSYLNENRTMIAGPAADNVAGGTPAQVVPEGVVADEVVEEDYLSGDAQAASGF